MRFCYFLLHEHQRIAHRLNVNPGRVAQVAFVNDERKKERSTADIKMLQCSTHAAADQRVHPKAA